MATVERSAALPTTATRLCSTNQQLPSAHYHGNNPVHHGNIVSRVTQLQPDSVATEYIGITSATVPSVDIYYHGNIVFVVTNQRPPCSHRQGTVPMVMLWSPWQRHTHGDYEIVPWLLFLWWFCVVFLWSRVFTNCICKKWQSCLQRTWLSSISCQFFLNQKNYLLYVKFEFVHLCHGLAEVMFWRVFVCLSVGTIT